MKIVDPIRDIKKITQIKNILRGKGLIRDLLLFELGINSALRITDLLKVKVKDLFDDNFEINNSFLIKENKTKKLNRIIITNKVKDTLGIYKQKYKTIIEKCDNYVFFHNKKFPLGNYNIGRKQAWLLINNWCKEVGLKGNFGGHTLRKTRGFQARIRGIALELIQHKLNHSSLVVTKRYLGITDSEIEEACNKLDL